jgi:hypothetical protein
MSMSGLTDEEFQHWCDHGYVIIRLLDDDELAAAVDNIHEYMPPWEEFARYRRRYSGTIGRDNRSLLVAQTFPFVDDGLNHTTIHPTLLDFATRALRTDRFMLSHGQLGGKYAGLPDADQDLHCDYGNNMLVVPKPDAATFDVPVIVYYTDVTVDLGPTYAVDQQYTRDDPLVPGHRLRKDHPDLYEHEFPVTVPAGHALLYSMRTFHRGSAIRAKEGLRFAQNIGFKRCDAPWAGQVTFQHEGGRPEMDHFLTGATPRQRELVGFPPVGAHYWDAASIAAVGRRYPEMDMTPYEA